MLYERWKEEYQKRLLTADQAAQLVKSGDWIEYGFGITSGRDFDEALAKRKDELKDVKIRCDIGAISILPLKQIRLVKCLPGTAGT